MLDQINSSISPIQLNDLLNSEDIEQVMKNLKNELSRTEKIISLQHIILDYYEEVKTKPLRAYSKTNIVEFNELIIKVKDHLDNFETTIQNTLNVRTEWFTPWYQILNLIKLTEDNVPVALNKISEIVGADEIHTEELLLLILQNNSLVGKYDGEKQIYTKGANITEYLAFAMEALKKMNFKS